MKPHRIAPVAAACLGLLTVPAVAHGSAEGPGTPQAIAAHAEFLSSLPAPPTGAGSVCVIDSGVDTDTDLGPALTTRSAFDNGTPNDVGALSDDGTELSKHGTYVAGVIASQVDGIGTSGIWPAARILSDRVFTGPKTGATAADYIRAVNWCINQGADVKVINLSLSGLTATLAERSQLENRITVVRQAPTNVNVVAAAGNSALGIVGYPASADGVFAVGSTDQNRMLSPFSNRGIGLDISTLGEDLCVTTARGSQLALGRGTSFAAPIVSAVLDAIRSHDPSLTPDGAERLLTDTADITPAGRVLNAARAFEAAGLITATQATQRYSSSQCDAPPPVAGSGRAQDSTSGTDSLPASNPDQADPESTAVPGREPADRRSTLVPIVNVQLASDKGLNALRPSVPIVRSVSLRRGVLTVRIAGRRAGETTIFRVTEKPRSGIHGSRLPRKNKTTSYTRGGSTLRVRAARWTTITIQLRRAGSGTSKPVTIHSTTDL